MSLEMERKFRLSSSAGVVGMQLPATQISQFYVLAGKDFSLRIRASSDGHMEYTIKENHAGSEREEYEMIQTLPEPVLKDLAGATPPAGAPHIVKARYAAPAEECMWIVDVFDGDNRGLVLAECELAKEVVEEVGLSRARDILAEQEVPTWMGAAQEVTGDPRFLNENLARNPFNRWGEGGA